MKIETALDCGIVGWDACMAKDTKGGRQFFVPCLFCNIGTHGGTLGNHLLMAQQTIGLSYARGTVRVLGFRDYIGTWQIGAIVLGNMYITCRFGVFGTLGNLMGFRLRFFKREEERALRVRLLYVNTTQLGGWLITFLVNGARSFVLGTKTVSKTCTLGNANMGKEAVRVFGCCYLYFVVYVNGVTRGNVFL